MGANMVVKLKVNASDQSEMLGFHSTVCHHQSLQNLFLCTAKSVHSIFNISLYNNPSFITGIHL